MDLGELNANSLMSLLSPRWGLGICESGGLGLTPAGY